MKIFEEIKKIKSGPKQLREFAYTMGIFFGLLAALLIWRRRPTYPWFAGLSAIFFAFAVFKPMALVPIQRAWMTLAVLIGWVMSRVILTVVYVVVLTPLSLIARMTGKKYLDLTFPDTQSSYWVLRKDKGLGKAKYENQF